VAYNPILRVSLEDDLLIEIYKTLSDYHSSLAKTVCGGRGPPRKAEE
jgi:hypothetical protein